ncbi:MAG: DUF21 domain-containing protein, partial [Synechococcaceae cyanobacterium SM2_3_60]|nr:DUF21 domain-containing protein [Synechococcaceae cyanobacterium SM2_3_60]
MMTVVLLLVLFLALSAVFSGAESAITALDNLKLQALIDESPSDAALYRLVQTQRTRFVTTLLVGNNLVNIGSAALATGLSIQLIGDTFGPIVATFLTTVIVLIFSEILPKSYAMSHSVVVFRQVVPPVYILSRLLTPIISGLEWLVQKTFWLLQVDIPQRQESVQDLALLVDILGRRGQLDWQKRQLFQGALALDMLLARDLVKPRVQMITIEQDKSLNDVIQLCLDTGFSRIPVQGRSKDDIVGLIHLKQALRYRDRHGDAPVTTAMQAPIFIPATKRIDALMRHMLRSR